MHLPRQLLLLLWLVGVYTSYGDALGEEARPLRVGGDYTVTAVDRMADREFHVEFRAVTASGKFDILNLHSDHIHIAVRKGEKLRLSAEILSKIGRAHV